MTIQSNLQCPILQYNIASRDTDIKTSLSPKFSNSLDQVLSVLKFEGLQMTIYVSLQILLVVELNCIWAVTSQDYVADTWT